ncbi:hypothetical protein ABPG72_020876, partial [Tetrahymena utriculariae]
QSKKNQKPLDSQEQHEVEDDEVYQENLGINITFFNRIKDLVKSQENKNKLIYLLKRKENCLKQHVQMINFQAGKVFLELKEYTTEELELILFSKKYQRSGQSSCQNFQKKIFISSQVQQIKRFGLINFIINNKGIATLVGESEGLCYDKGGSNPQPPHLRSYYRILQPKNEQSLLTYQSQFEILFKRKLYQVIKEKEQEEQRIFDEEIKQEELELEQQKTQELKENI